MGGGLVRSFYINKYPWYNTRGKGGIISVREKTLYCREREGEKRLKEREWDNEDF